MTELAAHYVADVEDLALDVAGTKLRADFRIAEAITGGELERTIDGASTLTLELHDPHRIITRSDQLRNAIDVQVEGQWWRLVKVGKSGDQVTLTFEDRDVAYLRRHSRPRKMSRNKMTRAEFVRALVREVGRKQPHGRRGKPVGQRPIRFVCPELHARQKIGKSSSSSSAQREETRGKGLSGSVTVKGKRASTDQRKNIETVLGVADDQNAGPKATKALVEACIVESEFTNLSGGDRDSQGILQLRATMHGSKLARSVSGSARKFLTAGFTGRGGAIELARQNPGWTAGAVAQGVQGSAHPERYDQQAAEADKIIAAFGGADAGGGSDTSGKGGRSYRKRYEFRRGEPGTPEDSWTAIQRLAEEVKWHAWMDRGRLFYMSDDRLMKSKARMVLSEDSPGVQGIDFDIDQGKLDGEVTINCRAALWQAPIGSVVVLEDLGLADGRWLVATVRRSLFDAATAITLRAPVKKLLEPAAETASTQGDDADAGGDGSLRSKIVAVAEASMKSYKRSPGAWFYSQQGASTYQDPTKPPKSGTRSDCSHWVCCVYKKAGAPPPGSAAIGATGTMRGKGHAVALSALRPGDLVLYGTAPSHHVELYVGPGSRTIGHGSAPVDYGTTTMQSAPQGWRYEFLDS